MPFIDDINFNKLKLTTFLIFCSAIVFKCKRTRLPTQKNPADPKTTFAYSDELTTINANKIDVTKLKNRVPSSHGPMIVLKLSACVFTRRPNVTQLDKFVLFTEYLLP